MALTTVVIPCFNEARRLDTEQLWQLLDGWPHIRLLLVDDGSTDGTAILLEDFRASRPERVGVLSLEHNSGKAEAVRRGMLRALDASSVTDAIGFADADLATPRQELGRLSCMILNGDTDVVIGSRVRLLGRAIERRPLRHYLGRVFATAASMVLGAAVYDTQCGAKFFRITPALAAALSRPFLSKWVFDVELLDRLMGMPDGRTGNSSTRLREEPLYFWRDVPGSKLRVRHMALAVIDLYRIWRLQRSRGS